MTGPPRVNLQCGPNPVRAGAFRRVPEIQGLYPKSKPPLLGVVLIFGLVADIAPQVELTSAKTPLSEQGDVKEEGSVLRYATDD